MSARSKSAFLPAAIGAAVLAIGSPAFADHVAEVAVNGRAPTHMTIRLAGKSQEAVRLEVHAAAQTVCRNAVSNRELGSQDLYWCKRKSATKALHRYAVIVASGREMAAAPVAIVLSAR